MAEKKKKKYGKKPFVIDWKRADELIAAGCPGTEVASHLGINCDTFYNHVKKDLKMEYSAYLQEKRSKGDALIRETQFNKAIGKSEKGDNTLLIWLGKQRLSQKEPESTIAKVPNDERLDKIFESLKLKKESDVTEPKTDIVIQPGAEAT
jgi:hypothetical protein